MSSFTNIEHSLFSNKIRTGAGSSLTHHKRESVLVNQKSVVSTILLCVPWCVPTSKRLTLPLRPVTSKLRRKVTPKQFRSWTRLLAKANSMRTKLHAIRAAYTARLKQWVAQHNSYAIQA